MKVVVKCALMAGGRRELGRDGEGSLAGYEVAKELADC
jgi:hypothetical protein